MSPGHAIPEPLQAFLFGRRRDHRFVLDAYAQVEIAGTPRPARALDVSRSGLLLAIEPCFLPEHGRPFEVQVPDVGLVATCSLTRIVWPREERGVLYAGCRFDQTLDEATWAALDLPPDMGVGDPSDRDASSFLPLQSREGTVLTVRAYEAGGDADVPLLEGRLVAAGDQTLVCLGQGNEFHDVLARISGRDLTLVVCLGLDPFWAVKATLLAARPSPDHGVEFVMVAESAPAQLLTRQLALREAC